MTLCAYSVFHEFFTTSFNIHWFPVIPSKSLDLPYSLKNNYFIFQHSFTYVDMYSWSLAWWVMIHSYNGLLCCSTGSRSDTWFPSPWTKAPSSEERCLEAKTGHRVLLGIAGKQNTQHACTHMYTHTHAQALVSLSTSVRSHQLILVPPAATKSHMFHSRLWPFLISTSLAKKETWLLSHSIYSLIY